MLRKLLQSHLQCGLCWLVPEGETYLSRPKYAMRQSWYSLGLLFQSLLQKLNLRAGPWKRRKRPRVSMKTKQNKTKQNKRKQKVLWRKGFLRSGDGHKVEGVTVAQKMRHAKNGARIKRFTLNEFLRLPTTFNPSSPAQSPKTDTGADPRRRHNKLHQMNL